MTTVSKLTTTSGTGTLTLVDILHNPPDTLTAGSCLYRLDDANGSAFERGLGTINSNLTQLARTTIYESTNHNNAIQLTTGPHEVTLYPTTSASTVDTSTLPSASTLDGTEIFAVVQGGTSKKTSVSSVLGAAIADVTYTVKASGGDFTTVGAAVAAAAATKTSSGVVGIVIDDGTWNLSSTIVSNPYIALSIQGNHTYTKSLTSIQSSSGSAGAWSIVLNVNSVSNIAANDYVVISNTSAGTNPTYIAGGFKVTNVDAVNTRITVSSTHGAATAPSGSVAGTVTVIKTVLNFTGVSQAIQVWNDTAAINIAGLAIVCDGTADGLSVQDGSRAEAFGPCAIMNCLHGLIIIASADFFGTASNCLGISNCETAMNVTNAASFAGCLLLNGNDSGIVASMTGAASLSGNTVITGCSTGINVATNAAVTAQSATSVAITGNVHGLSISGAAIMAGSPSFANNSHDDITYVDYTLGILHLTALITTPDTVNNLPAATAGARAFVTDANATTYGTVVHNGGSNVVPVWADGVNWNIG